MTIKPLGEIADVLISNVDKKSKENEKKVKLCNFVDVYYNWAITTYTAKDFMIATASDNAIEKFMLKKGDVAITKDSETRDDIGVATYIAEDLENTLLGYHCVLIRPNSDVVIGKYLNVILHSEYAQKYFEANASGSGQRYTLTDTIVKQMPIPLPDLCLQRKIGEIPSIIDKKIVNNIILSTELAEMARFIYDYWFVQFDFPNESGQPYKASGGQMVWNEQMKREIPLGWSCETIESITERVKVGFVGTVDKFYCEKEDGYPIIRPAEMGENGIDYTNLNHITEEFYEKNIKSQVKKGDILISRCGKDGIPNIYDSDERAQVLNAVIIVPNSEKADSLFINETIKSPYVQKQISHGTSGSVQGVINTAMIAKLTLPYNQQIVEKYCHMMREIYERISINRKQNDELLSLRKFLIPMLVNGQIDFMGGAICRLMIDKSQNS